MPVEERAGPGPLVERALVGFTRVDRLLVERDPAVGRRTREVLGQGVPADLGDPDRLGGVAVADHRLAQELGAREVHAALAEPAVARPGPEPVALRAQDVEIAAGAVLVHLP